MLLNRTALPINNYAGKLLPQLILTCIFLVSCTTVRGIERISLLYIDVIVYCRWRAHIILSRLPQESWPEMQLKCAAYEALNKRRANWGYNRTWLGDYLAQVKGFNPSSHSVSA